MPTTRAFLPSSGRSRMDSGFSAGSSGGIGSISRRTSFFEAASGRSASAEHVPRMNRDHLFFIGGNDPRRGAAAFGGDARPPGGVGGDIEADAEPLGAPAHALTNRGR